jgi:uncharacterized Ntn-hydrolase superfamily protein
MRSYVKAQCGKVRYLALSLVLLYLTCAHADATYSIVACDASKACGVAVETDNLAVGASVPYAKFGVGAVASQYETNPDFGTVGLSLLERGGSARNVLDFLIAHDNGFDGQGPPDRQVGIVGVAGDGAAYTGAQALDSQWAGAIAGPGFSIQGNGLAGPQVLEAMRGAFLANHTDLGARLLASLQAGDAAGGQSTGRQSAALLVRTRSGFPFDIDLRVDSASDPVDDLAKLYGMQVSRQELVDADHLAHRGKLSEARAAVISAVARAPMWPRTWIAAARVATDIDEPNLAIQYLTLTFSSNVAWAKQEIGSGRYAMLGSDPLFAKWVSSEQRQKVLEDFNREDRWLEVPEAVALGTRLLEVNLPEQARAVLIRLPRSGVVDILIAQSYRAQGQLDSARVRARAAASEDPGNALVQAEAQSIAAP